MELKLHVPNRVRLLSNADTNVTTQLLVALCLRFRPDRIIVGEVRGGEAYDLLQALNTGHDGGLASIHANNARTALSRLESLAMLGIPAGLPLGTGGHAQEHRRLLQLCGAFQTHGRDAPRLRNPRNPGLSQ